MKENRLVHIEVVFKKVGRKMIVGRIVQYNQKEKSLPVYNEDRKTVEHIMMNEIDDISPTTSTRT